MKNKPYQKICSSLDNEIREIKNEVAFLPKNVTRLLLNKAVNFVTGSEEKYLLHKRESIVSRLDIIKGKAKSTLNTLQLSSLETDSEKRWQDKLIDIVLEVDSLLQEVRRNASFIDGKLESEGLRRAKANDLPRKLNLKITKEELITSENKEILATLNSLYKKGILTKEEYDEKIRRLS